MVYSFRKRKAGETMYLYHIKRPGMSLKEGYIGITVNTTKRFAQHLRDTKNRNRHNRNYHLYNAMRKYEDIEFVILKEGEFEYVRKLEYKLRPLPSIGWNQAVGGSHNGGCTWKGKKRPEHSEAMKVKGFQKGNSQGSEHPILAAGFVFKNKKEASRILGVNAKTIYNRCKRGREGYMFLRDRE
jgi:predicted GIY-YIG superfamily endonuclease